MKEDNILKLIPKTEKYIQYVIELLIKLPRIEKFSIGTEYKTSMYKMLEYVLYINKAETNERIYYLNKIDMLLNVQRIYLRIMHKNRWIDDKKFNITIEMIYEMGKILGGLIKHYAKNNKK